MFGMFVFVIFVNRGWDRWVKKIQVYTVILLYCDFCFVLSAGVYVIGFSYPVVPKGKARIRVQISAAHTDEDIDHCVDAFIQTGRKHGVIS